MNRLLAILTGGAFVFAMTMPALAGIEESIEHRKAAYAAIGGHMKAMVAIVKGAPHGGDMQFHADSMARLAVIVENAFPEGSEMGETDARPVIWEKPAEFKKVMEAFKAEAGKMAKTAATGDMRAAAAQIGELGKACKACHDSFRVQK